jgi:sugar/nucleoside kinase (ribokinase family)
VVRYVFSPVRPTTLRHAAGTLTLHKHCRTTGGSAANVMKGLSKISNGQLRCSFLGMAGMDDTAEEYREQMAAYGVRPLLLVRGPGT